MPIPSTALIQDRPGTLAGLIYILDSSNSIVHSHFDLVSLLLVQFATRTVSQMATQMIVCLSVQMSFRCNSKEIGGKT